MFAIYKIVVVVVILSMSTTSASHQAVHRLVNEHGHILNVSHHKLSGGRVRIEHHTPNGHIHSHETGLVNGKIPTYYDHIKRGPMFVTEHDAQVNIDGTPHNIKLFKHHDQYENLAHENYQHPIDRHDMLIHNDQHFYLDDHGAIHNHIPSIHAILPGTGSGHNSRHDSAAGVYRHDERHAALRHEESGHDTSHHNNTPDSAAGGSNPPIIPVESSGPASGHDSSTNRPTVRRVPNNRPIQSHNTIPPSQSHTNPSPPSGEGGSTLFQRLAHITMGPPPAGHAGVATPPPQHVIDAAVANPGLMSAIPHLHDGAARGPTEVAGNGTEQVGHELSAGSTTKEWWRWKAPELVQKDSRFSFKKWRRGEGEPPMEFQHKNLDYAAALGNEIFIGAPVKALAHTVMSVSEPISKAVHATGQVGSSVGGAVGETVGGLLYGADEIVQAGKQVGQDLEPSSFSTRLGGGGGVGRQ